MEQFGIPLSNFRALEKANSPLPEQLTELYPQLNSFKGFALNLYRAQITRTSNPPKIVLFPSLLSSHSEDADFLQIDLLQDQRSLRPIDYKRDEPIHPQHALLITSLSKFIANRTPTAAHSNRYTHVCRNCCSVYISPKDLSEHKLICRRLPTGGKCEKRQSENKKVHQMYVYDNTTKALKRNGISFSRGDLYKTLCPLYISFLDLECLSEDMIPDATRPETIFRPKDAISHLTAFGWSYVHAPAYKSNPLPPPLRAPRGRFYDPTKQSESDFWLSLLISMRDDLIQLNEFLDDVLSSDLGPMPYSEMSSTEKEAFNAKIACEICGRRFGSTYLNQQGRPCHVVKNRDHNHYLRSRHTVAALCSVSLFFFRRALASL